VAETIAPGGERMRALSNDNAAPGRGNRANALCAKINAKPVASFPFVTGRDADLRCGLPASGSWRVGRPQIQTKKKTAVLWAPNSLESRTRKGVNTFDTHVRLCYPL
jgi:hypothetical protein